MKLITRPPKRLFAFGCSFTEYHWATWPQIVAHDLDIPMYNLGRCGAGNQYIGNLFTQALNVYDINSDDLVMICWSGFLREDRWIRGNWQVRGDITSHGDIYDSDFIDKYVDPVGCYVRDLATMSWTRKMLEHIGCQYHMLSMCDLMMPEQGQNQIDPDNHVIATLKNTYSDIFHNPPPSFEIDLWQGNMRAIKTQQVHEKFRCKYGDWHPTPIEQYEFLSNVFSEHAFSPETVAAVKTKDHQLVQIVRQAQSRFTDYFALPDLPAEEHALLFDKLFIVENHLDTDLIVYW